MKQKIILITILLVGLILVKVFAKNSPALNPDSSDAENSKIHVVASFYPLAEFTQQIGREHVSVTNLTPAGAEPHDFEPSPQNLVALEKSKMFVYNGAGLELWLEDIAKNLSSEVLQIKASAGIELLENDPHVWLDPVFASQQVKNILQGLVTVDPEKTGEYTDSALAYQQQLADLDQAFQTGLASCQTRTIVTSHNAFQYLAKRYNLKVLSISGLSPDEEPTPQKLVEVVQFVQANNVQYIFFESLVSPKISETVAREVGAQTIAFNPLEGLTESEIAAGKNYISIQQENLAALRTALGCK